jgi:hypothetical protein
VISLHFAIFWYERTFGRWTGVIEKFRMRGVVAWWHGGISKLSAFSLRA